MTRGLTRVVDLATVGADLFTNSKPVAEESFHLVLISSWHTSHQFDDFAQTQQSPNSRTAAPEFSTATRTTPSITATRSLLVTFPNITGFPLSNSQL